MSIRDRMQEVCQAPLPAVSSRAKTRRVFTGTSKELCEEFKLILQNRCIVDLDVLAPILVDTVAQEIHLNEAVKEAGITLELLLVAYGFCNKRIALEKINITDLENLFTGRLKKDVNLCASFVNIDDADDAAGSCSTKDLKLSESSDALSQRLLKAFVENSPDVQTKSVIEYVVNVGYKRSSGRGRLVTFLENHLIDGISFGAALEEYPDLQRIVAKEYSQRCQAVHTFLSKKLPQLLVDVAQHKPIRVKSTSGINSVLTQADANLINVFLCEMRELGCEMCEEFAIHIVENCFKTKITGATVKVNWSPEGGVDWMKAHDIHYKSNSLEGSDLF